MELISTHLILKLDLGFHNSVFGGKILSWVDCASASYCMQLCDTPRVVTASIDKCNFEKPAKEGQLVKIYGTPSKLGNTSLTLYIEVRLHNVYTGKQSLILKTNICFVNIDDEGNPIPIGDKARNRINKIFKNTETLVEELA
jgi:acyl-CoA thioesterase YciA